VDRPERKRPASLPVAPTPGTTANPLSWLTPSSPVGEDGTPLARPRRAARALRATVARGDGAPPGRAHASRALPRRDRRHGRRRGVALSSASSGTSSAAARSTGASRACGATDAASNVSCRFPVKRGLSARAVAAGAWAEQAAHLVDAVLPSVPVPQWVLTVPHRLRYRLAFDHALCRAVLGVFIRTVLGWYRRRGRRAGIPAGQSGTVTEETTREIPAALGRSESSRDARRSGNLLYAIENVVRFAK